jgi:hypothetical protein
MGSQCHMKWFVLESFPAAWLEILKRYCWSPCPVDTTVYSPPMSLNSLQSDVSLMLSFNAVHRWLHWGECSTCWRTHAWFSFVETVTDRPDWLPLPLTKYTTRMGKLRNYRQHNSVTWCHLIKSLLELFWYLFQTQSPFTTTSVWAEIIHNYEYIFLRQETNFQQ